MSQSPKPRGLGRGLSALLGDEEIASTVTAPPPPAPDSAARDMVSGNAASRPPLTLPIGHLRPGKMQPRTTFEDIEVLVESVKEFGLLQPILVRPIAGVPDSYEIVAGERRWRAAQKAQLHDVPVVVRPMGDQDALQLGLIENLQRADLTAIDEALAYRRLQQDFDQSHDDIARTVGKSRPHVANTVRLLELPEPVQEMVRGGQLSAGQARALIGVPDPLAMAQRAMDEKLTVRELERLGGDPQTQAQGRRADDGRAEERRHAGPGEAHRGGARPQGQPQAPRSGRAEPAHLGDPRFRSARQCRRPADAALKGPLQRD